MRVGLQCKILQFSRERRACAQEKKRRPLTSPDVV
jgi:hypothetical protein